MLYNCSVAGLVLHRSRAVWRYSLRNVTTWCRKKNAPKWFCARVGSTFVMCWLVPQPVNMHHIVPNETYIVALLQGSFLHGYGLYVVTVFRHTPLNAENHFVQFNSCFVSHAFLHHAFIAVLSLHWCCAAVVFDNQICHTVPLCLSLTTMIVAQCYCIHCLFLCRNHLCAKSPS